MRQLTQDEMQTDSDKRQGQIKKKNLKDQGAHDLFNLRPPTEPVAKVVVKKVP